VTIKKPRKDRAEQRASTPPLVKTTPSDFDISINVLQHQSDEPSNLAESSPSKSQNLEENIQRDSPIIDQYSFEERSLETGSHP
jgi:hypothetical protein